MVRQVINKIGIYVVFIVWIEIAITLLGFNATGCDSSRA